MRSTKRPLRTSDIARAVGVHPNTVRIYEQWGFLQPVPRAANGYRLYGEEHLEQMRLARLALHFPYPGGKEPVLRTVLLARDGDLAGALESAHAYLAQVRAERAEAETAASLLERWAQAMEEPETGPPLRIGEVSRLLGITTDALRNWERNGLIEVPRDRRNGYRRYGRREISRLRVIRLLRSAGYSTTAILRSLLRLDSGETTGLREALDTPPPDEDLVYISDRWLSTLAEQEARAREIIAQVEAMLRRRAGTNC